MEIVPVGTTHVNLPGWVSAASFTLGLGHTQIHKCERAHTRTVQTGGHFNEEAISTGVKVVFNFLFLDLETTMSGTRWRPASTTFSVDSAGLSTMGRSPSETPAVMFVSARSLLLRCGKHVKKSYLVAVCMTAVTIMTPVITTNNFSDTSLRAQWQFRQ